MIDVLFIFNIIVSFTASFIVLTSFGVGIISHTIPKVKDFEKLVLSTLLGTTLLASVLFFLGLLTGSIQAWVVFLFLIFGLYWLPETLLTVKSCFPIIKRNKLLSIFSIFSSISLASTVSFSWLNTKAGLLMQQGTIHDSVWHIALINKLNQSIPPEHPSSYQFFVEEYHYLFDLVIAGLTQLNLSSNVIFYQITPIYLSILLALSSLILIKKLTNGSKASMFSIIFLLFFTGNLAYFLPFILQDIKWSESSFWVSQTFNSMINPQLIYSFVILLTTLSLIHNDYYDKLKSKGKLFRHILISLLIASSIGFKSYVFLILAVIYGLYLFLLFIQKKFYSIWLLLIFALMSLPFVFSFVNFSSSTFIFLPLWFVDTMFEAQDRLNYPNMTLIEEHYKVFASPFKYFLLKTIQIVIFYIGNLGTRSLIIVLPFLLIYKKFRKWFSSPVNYLVAIGFVISSIVPMLFIQKGIVWNSIQFWYYTLIFANIILASIIGYFWNIIFKSSEGKDNSSFKYIFYIFISVFIVLSIPTYFQTMGIKFSKPMIIRNEELSAIRNVSSNKKILICKEEGEYFYDTSMISALTGASIYYADPDQLSIIDVDVDPYKLEMKRIFADKDPNFLDSFVKSKNIDYIICNDKNWYNMFVGLQSVHPDTNKNEKQLYSVKVIPFCSVDYSLYLK